MLKLICRALVGGAKYCDVYMASDMGEDYGSTTKMMANNITVSTLQEVTRKVARLEKMQLDEKQYIAYEMIACTFLLDLVKDGNDSNTTLFTSLQKTIGRNPSSEIIKGIGDKLQAKGSRAINYVSYRTSWIREKHSRESGRAILL
jgi:hypothetical protein